MDTIQHIAINGFPLHVILYRKCYFIILVKHVYPHGRSAVLAHPRSCENKYKDRQMSLKMIFQKDMRASTSHNHSISKCSLCPEPGCKI